MLCLAMIQICHAKDTAMVTQIDGEGIMARIATSSWQPALGEVLPASVSIDVDAGSTLGLLHLFADSELTIHGPKNFMILEERFEGIDAGDVKKVETFVGKLDLGSNSLKMVGAISADKISYGSGMSKACPARAPDKSVGSGDEYKMTKSVLFPDDIIEGELMNPPSPGMDGPDSLLKSGGSSRTALATLKKELEGVAEDVEAEKQEIAGVKKKDEKKAIGISKKIRRERELVWLGLPKTTTSNFKKVDKLQLFDDQKPFKSIKLRHETILSPIDDWTLFTFDSTKVKNEAKLLLGEKRLDAPNIELLIAPIGEKGLSVLAAMIHESNRRFEQAAGIWLKLASEGKVNTKILTGHLERLMLKMQVK